METMVSVAADVAAAKIGDKMSMMETKRIAAAFMDNHPAVLLHSGLKMGRFLSGACQHSKTFFAN
jgi:hypothetical protein